MMKYFRTRWGIAIVALGAICALGYIYAISDIIKTGDLIPFAAISILVIIYIVAITIDYRKEKKKDELRDQEGDS